MTQRTRGARDPLERIEDAIRDIREACKLGSQDAHDPRFVVERFAEIEDDIATIARAIREELEPLLLRRSPKTESRLDRLEEADAERERTQSDMLERLARLERAALVTERNAR